MRRVCASPWLTSVSAAFCVGMSSTTTTASGKGKALPAPGHRASPAVSSRAATPSVGVNVAGRPTAHSAVDATPAPLPPPVYHDPATWTRLDAAGIQALHKSELKDHLLDPATWPRFASPVELEAALSPLLRGDATLDYESIHLLLSKKNFAWVLYEIRDVLNPTCYPKEKPSPLALDQRGWNVVHVYTEERPDLKLFFVGYPLVRDVQYTHVTDIPRIIIRDAINAAILGAKGIPIVIGCSGEGKTMAMLASAATDAHDPQHLLVHWQPREDLLASLTDEEKGARNAEALKRALAQFEAKHFAGLDLSTCTVTLAVDECGSFPNLVRSLLAQWETFPSIAKAQLGCSRVRLVLAGTGTEQHVLVPGTLPDSYRLISLSNSSLRDDDDEQFLNRMLKRLPHGKHLTLDQLPGKLRALVHNGRCMSAFITYAQSFAGERTLAVKDHLSTDLLAAQEYAVICYIAQQYTRLNSLQHFMTASFLVYAGLVWRLLAAQKKRPLEPALPNQPTPCFSRSAATFGIPREYLAVMLTKGVLVDHAIPVVTPGDPTLGCGEYFRLPPGQTQRYDVPLSMQVMLFYLFGTVPGLPTSDAFGEFVGFALLGATAAVLAPPRDASASPTLRSVLEFLGARIPKKDDEALNAPLPQHPDIRPLIQLQVPLEASNFRICPDSLHCTYHWDPTTKKAIASLPANSVTFVRNCGSAAYADTIVVYKLERGVTVTLLLQTNAWIGKAGMDSYVPDSDWNLALLRMGSVDPLAIAEGVDNIEHSPQIAQGDDACWSKDCFVPQPKVFGHVVPAFCGTSWLRPNQRTECQTRADAVEIAVAYDTDADHAIEPPFRELWELTRATAEPKPCEEIAARDKKQ